MLALVAVNLVGGEVQVRCRGGRSGTKLNSGRIYFWCRDDGLVARKVVPFGYSLEEEGVVTVVDIFLVLR